MVRKKSSSKLLSLTKQLNQLSKDQLYELAKKLVIPGRSRMSKLQMVDTLKRYAAKVKPLLLGLRKSIGENVKTKSEEPLEATKQTQAKAESPNAAGSARDKTIADWQGESGPDLPESYNETVLHAMPQNDHTVYVYWEIDEHTRKQVEQSYSNSTVLRVYGGSKKPELEISVQLNQGQQYIELEPNHTYAFELGAKNESDQYKTVVRSNLLTLPPKIEHVYAAGGMAKTAEGSQAPGSPSSWMNPSSSYENK